MKRDNCYGCPALNNDGTCTVNVNGRDVTIVPYMELGCIAAPDEGVASEEKHKAAGAAQLKPCPFCGGDAFVSYDPEGIIDSMDRHWSYIVVCGRCCATTGLTYSNEKAIEAWNRRSV